MKTQQITEENFIETLKYNDFHEFVNQKNTSSIFFKGNFNVILTPKSFICHENDKDFPAGTVTIGFFNTLTDLIDFVIKLEHINLKPLPAKQTLWDWALENGWDKICANWLKKGNFCLCEYDTYYKLISGEYGLVNIKKSLVLEKQIKLLKAAMEAYSDES